MIKLALFARPGFCGLSQFLPWFVRFKTKRKTKTQNTFFSCSRVRSSHSRSVVVGDVEDFWTKKNPPKWILTNIKEFGCSIQRLEIHQYLVLIRHVLVDELMSLTFGFRHN